MSVLIKGIKIPKNCGDCPFCAFTADEKKYIGYCNTSDDDYYCKVLDRFMEYDEIDGGVDILGKPDDCPLVEVPTSHGRLIDADELEADMINGIRAGNLEEGYERYQNINDVDDCVDYVRYADTVIEADGEG